MKNELAQYSSFITGIKELIYQHQYEAMRQVNRALIGLYWRIGEEIFCKQQEQGWGKSVIEILSTELKKEFPGVAGFSTTNLWRMRSFYLEYSQNANLPLSVGEIQKTNLPPSVGEMQSANLPPLVAEISWSKHCVIIEKCKDPLQREFYIKMTKRFGWTKDVLIHNIDCDAYEKYLKNQTNFDKTIARKYKHQAKLAVKDEYIFDFLEMGEEHDEKELELALLMKIRAFLVEMGGYYTYAGNQFHLDIADDDYHVDVLLFHRQLRSLIAIDFKVGEFKPEYAGKMQFYLAALDEKVKLPDENPSIGIIVCRSKNRIKVEYALRLSNAPIGVATYKLHNELPKEMQSLLPSPDEIETLISTIE